MPTLISNQEKDKNPNHTLAWKNEKYENSTYR